MDPAATSAQQEIGKSNRTELMVTYKKNIVVEYVQKTKKWRFLSNNPLDNDKNNNAVIKQGVPVSLFLEVRENFPLIWKVRPTREETYRAVLGSDAARIQCRRDHSSW